jgi:hypothetical protein
MPAVSKKQRKAMAIAEHDPKSLNPENAGLKKMSKGQLHDFASTKEKNLPDKVKKPKKPKTKKAETPRYGSGKMTYLHHD